jgi:hypothetical protein
MRRTSFDYPVEPGPAASLKVVQLAKARWRRNVNGVPVGALFVQQPIHIDERLSRRQTVAQPKGDEQRPSYSVERRKAAPLHNAVVRSERKFSGT